jgi:hypothetical protein
MSWANIGWLVLGWALGTGGTLLGVILYLWLR